MWTKATVASLIISAVYATHTFAAEPQFIYPDSTQFKFTSEAKGSNKFCYLVVSAVKVLGGPAAVARGVALGRGVALNAVAGRRSSGNDSITFGYEVKAFETTIENGIPSAPKSLKIRGAEISSRYFSSTGTVDKVGTEGAVYTVKEAGLSGFTATMIVGSYSINIDLLDGRGVSYLIEANETLLDAADKWTKCSIEIAK